MKPEQGTERSCEPSGERSGQADCGARLQRNAKRLPSDISAQAGKKDGHVCGQSAALDVDEVAHFMNQNDHCKANAEFWSPQGPVETNESDKAEQEFQLEQKQEGAFGLRQKKCQR